MINDKGEFGKVSKIRKKKIKKTNILLGFICILLAVLLGFILVTSYKSEQKESRHLSEIADDQQSGIEDYEAVKERAKELEEISSEEAEDTEDIKSKNTEDTKDTEKTETSTAKRIKCICQSRHEAVVEWKAKYTFGYHAPVHDPGRRGVYERFCKR